MPHFRVDDAFHSHPKAQRAGDDAIGLWVRAGSYCMAYLTNGFVPEWWVKSQPKGMQKARKLVAAALWHAGAEQDGERGFMFHEFVGPMRQDSREQIEADREKWRKRKQRQREMSHGDTHGDTQRDNPGDTHGDIGRDMGREPRVYTQPNPTQPLSVVTSGGELTQVGPPGPHCQKHPNGTDRPCRACAEARRDFEAREIEHNRALARQRSDFWAEVERCTDCDERGNVDHGNSVSKCEHHDWKAIRNA